MRIDYTLRFERGWRIGSGEAAGRELDSLIRRDALGLPFVPGSTVRGLVREAARQLSGALALKVCDGTLSRRDGALGTLCGVNRAGRCPLCALSGSPHAEPSVEWGPARLVLAEIEGSADDRRRLAEVAVQVPGLLSRPRPRTAIDAASGRAADEQLFTLEEALERLELRGALTLDPALSHLEVSLLVAALRFVREAGGSRRRGLGACRIRIDRADLAPAFAGWREALEALKEGGSPAGEGTLPPAPPPAAARAPLPSTAPSARTLLQIDARVVGEVVAGGRPEAGNLIAGLPYVAGSSLRGALAARWRGDRAGEDFLRCFVSGKVRFGFLYPLAGQAVARPVPLSKQTCKLHPGSFGARGHGFVDLLLHPEAERCQVPGCRGRLIPWGPAFEGPAETVRQRLAISPHNRIDPESQTVALGGLFAYQAIPEATLLRGFIEAESAEDLERLLFGLGLSPGADFELRVGRRKGALGHLECRLTDFTGRPSGVGLLPDAPLLPDAWPGSGLLRLDLVTPALLADQHLRWRECLSPRDLGVDRDRFDEVFAGTERVAGWNSAHRLPKSDQLALAAGSSFLLARPENGAGGELAALARAAREGVGRRRAEGFGVLTVQAVTEDDRKGGTA